MNYITSDELSRVHEIVLAKLKFRSELFTYPAGDESYAVTLLQKLKIHTQNKGEGHCKGIPQKVNWSVFRLSY